MYSGVHVGIKSPNDPRRQKRRRRRKGVASTNSQSIKNEARAHKSRERGNGILYLLRKQMVTPIKSEAAELHSLAVSDPVKSNAAVRDKIGGC